MNQQKSDQGWQQLQAHIEGFFGRALRNDLQRIEYKPAIYDPAAGDALRTSAEPIPGYDDNKRQPQPKGG